MRNAYEKLNYEVIRFQSEDIITTSGEPLDTAVWDGREVGLFLTADGHYVTKDMQTGEIIMDHGTTDPRIPS